MTGPFSSTQLRFSLCFMFLLAFIHDVTSSRLERGQENFSFGTTDSKDINPSIAIRGVSKNMFGNTEVKIIVEKVVTCDPSTSFTIGWELRYTKCAQLYTVKNGELLLEDLAGNPSAMYSVEPEISIIAATSEIYQCPEDPSDIVPEFPPSNDTTCYEPPPKKNKNCDEGTILMEDNKETIEDDSKDPTEDDGNDPTEDDGNDPAKDSPTEPHRRKRAAEGGDADPQHKNNDLESQPKHVVARTTTTGSYLLILNITASSSGSGFANVSLKVTVDMKSPNGYLSAFQYPLLKFYGIMCGVYTLFGFTWLFLLCRQYQDLLGIQIWIGVVILLGLIEKAAFYGEFEHMNNKGGESNTGILLAELVSCVKRTLARLLVVIVSIGYGITRPRLGTDLNYVMAAGLLYMTLSSAEAIMRVSESYEHSMVAVLPLSVLEAILVWWILRNLVDTTRTLRLRNNDTKLWLYRHFTNTLLLCIVFSVIFSIWTMKTHRFSDCIEKHYELWLDDAFWHILFCVILFVVMILFRPSANNQRYAYSPLLDEEQEDEESKEPMLSEAYDGMKMRNLKKDNPQNAVKDIAEDLKWVEDNIPAAIADSALAIMDDSEEELVTNLERSKMD